MIEVSRTLMKSEPELAELVATVEGVEVTMAEKGFGTRVEIRADRESGLELADLERLLDQLAEPQKQPFGNS
jgi:carbon monoxide dehydrogenase subunit G